MAKGHAGGPVDEPVDMSEYPPAVVISHITEKSRHYRDEAAFKLYQQASAGKIAAAHGKLATALSKQAAKMEEFFNTPYTEDSARVLEASTAALIVMERQLERWHYMLYPNQRPTET